MFGSKKPDQVTPEPVDEPVSDTTPEAVPDQKPDQVTSPTPKKGAYADDQFLSNPEFLAAGERLLSAVKFYWLDRNGYSEDPSRETLIEIANEVLSRTQI